MLGTPVFLTFLTRLDSINRSLAQIPLNIGRLKQLLKFPPTGFVRLTQLKRAVTL